MALVYLTVEGNLEPALELTARRRTGPIDLTGCTVNLIILNPKTKTITNTGHQGCTLTSDPTTGIVHYNVQAGDFPNPDIDYKAELQIIHANTKPEILYDILIIDQRKKLTPTP